MFGWLSSLLGKKTDPAAGAATGAAAEPAQSASFWDNLNPFKSKKPQPEVISAAAQNNNPPATGANLADDSAQPTTAAPPPPGQVGGRKTRHRRRSPRRHRK
jgi:hypothetical protein